MLAWHEYSETLSQLIIMLITKYCQGWTKNYFVYAIAGLFLCSLSGCLSSRDLTYFQGTTAADDTVLLAASYIPTVQPGDILSIQITSLNSQASSFFNPYSVSPTNFDNVPSPTNTLPPTTGYLVSTKGTITMPLIGNLQVQGLTNVQIGDLVRTKLSDYLKEPTVNVRNLNFKVSVLGEVARPALFTIPNEQLTLPEALGLAGDLTIYGRRDNVMVIRQEKGKRVFARLDLTKRNAFRSPYYTLHPNDIVYVEPGKNRLASADRFFQVTPVVTSILSLIAIIATR